MMVEPQNPVEFQVIVTETKYVTKPLRGAIVCPHCGSLDVEVSPAIVFCALQKFGRSYSAYLACEVCGKTVSLTDAENVALAEWIIANIELYDARMRFGLRSGAWMVINAIKEKEAASR